jgi:V8-like Glu-specific endopeptidase
MNRANRENTMKPGTKLASSVLALVLFGWMGSAAAVQDEETPTLEETIVSPSLRFEGRVVGTMHGGKPIRERAYFRGREFVWRRETGHRLPTPDEEPFTKDEGGVIDDMSLDELAQNLRGLALFEGHEFFESAPAYDLALDVKNYVEMERGGASPETLQRFFPGVPASQGATPRELVRSRGTRPSASPLLVPGEQITQGPDNRIVLNNLIYPHRVHIVFDNTGSTATIDESRGSGALIGPSTAMSVAHVFFDNFNDTWWADHRWAPGYDSQDADPSPWGEWYRCYWVIIPAGYASATTASATHDFDFAILDFDAGCNSVRNGVNSDHPGSTVGWLGNYTAPASEIEARTGYVRGYPGPGNCGSPAQACNVRVWGGTSSLGLNDATSTAIHHQADTTSGQSGSAYYLYTDPSCSGCGLGAYLVGMHSAGSGDYNIARRYTSAVRSFMKAYSSDY